MSDALEACNTCRFFIPGAKARDRDGSCHRHAPSEWQLPPREDTYESDAVTVDGESHGVATMISMMSYVGWPEIRASDWCGEYEISEIPSEDLPSDVHTTS